MSLTANDIPEDAFELTDAPDLFELGDAPEPTADLTALVLSDSPGLAEMVARGLCQEGAMDATPIKMSIVDFVKTPDLSLDLVSVILFEIVQGDDAQLNALRHIRDQGPDHVKVVGLTSEVLSLATAKQMMEAGVDDVVPLGAQSPKLSDAAPLEPAEAFVITDRGGTIHNGMIIGITQTRGGIGATTFALNLATMLSAPRKGKHKVKGTPTPRVAIVDLDLQNGTLGARIDVQDNDAFVEILREGITPDSKIIKALMQPHEVGFDVLPAPVEFVPLDAMQPNMMAAMLEELRQAYDFVILDMPRSIVDWLDPVLARVDQVYMLTDTAVHSVRQARRMVDFFGEDHVALPLEIIVSMERKPKVSRAAAKEAERFLNRTLSHWIPRDDRAAGLATDRGQTLIEASPRSSVAKAMTPILTDLKTYFAAETRRQA